MPRRRRPRGGGGRRHRRQLPELQPGLRLGSRVLVARPLYDTFIERLADASPSSRGLPDDARHPHGPGGQRQAAQIGEAPRRVSLAEARACCAADRPLALPGLEGVATEPTVFVDVRNDMRIAREEIFGPVLVVMPFDTDDRAGWPSPTTASTDWPARYGRATCSARRCVADRVRTGTMWDQRRLGAVRTSRPSAATSPAASAASSATRARRPPRRARSSTRQRGPAQRGTFKSVLPYPRNTVHLQPADQAGVRPEVHCQPAQRAASAGARRRDHPPTAARARRRGGRGAARQRRALHRRVRRRGARPHYECADAAIALCRELGADSRSAWAAAARSTAAKLTLVAPDQRRLGDREHGPDAPGRPLLPHMAIPTTHGTGSEVTLGAVITNAQCTASSSSPIRT